MNPIILALLGRDGLGEQQLASWWGMKNLENQGLGVCGHSREIEPVTRLCHSNHPRTSPSLSTTYPTQIFLTASATPFS